MATKKKAPKDPEALRAQLMEDPETKAIAKHLGVELKDYVAQVLHFVQNPSADPQVYVAEDEDLRSIGWEPADGEAIGKHLVEAVAVAKAADATEYTDPRKRLVTLDQAPAQVIGKPDKKLQDELTKQLRTKRGGKG